MIEDILFHGYNNVNHFVEAMRNNRMNGHTSQRYWNDGKRRRDNDSEYETSNWMKGVSFTRDIRYAMRWGSVVIAVDRQMIRNRHRLIPFNWGFSIPPSPNFSQNYKREREEFAVTHLGDQYFDEDGARDMGRFMSCEGSIDNLEAMIRGVWVDICLVEGNFAQDMNCARSHPMFKGYYRADGKKVTMIKSDDRRLVA